MLCDEIMTLEISIHSAIASGDRRQETGDRRQETGDRRQETNYYGKRRKKFQSTPLSLAETYSPAAALARVRISIYSAIASGDR